MKDQVRSKTCRRLRAALCVVLAAALVLPCALTAIIYEVTFDRRYETAAWMEFSAQDFNDLCVQRSDFESDGVTLAGYRYAVGDVQPKGVVVVAHGMGGGGQNGYMPMIYAFASGGYAVFAYDARGNDQSGGGGVKGFPQGVIDLDSAICHVQSLAEYRNLPIVLFGHSWGAYSASCVLALHPEVRAAVLVAGFNAAADMLRLYGTDVAGDAAELLMAYFKGYELLKFGNPYASLTALEGMQRSDAGIMIVQSRDDETVPMACGYDQFYTAFSEDARFEFVLYENRGHSYLFYSEASYRYRRALNEAYASYIAEGNLEYNAENKEAFMRENLDLLRCFEVDSALVERMLALYDRCCE